MAPSHHLSLARQPKRLWIAVRFCAVLVLPLAESLLHLRLWAQM
jgi:hypothetical protein